MILKGEKYCFSVIKKDERGFWIEIKALKAGLCKNDWNFIEQGIRECAETFRGQPILCAYKGFAIGDGHNYSEYIDPATQERIYDFRGSDAERIVGCIPVDAKIEVKDIDGEIWIVLQGLLWTHYARQLVDDIIKKGFKEVSSEVDATDSEMHDNGIEDIKKWVALGITILGDGVEPAVTGARLKQLSASKQYKELAAKMTYNNQKQKGVNNYMNKNEKKKALCSLLTGFSVITLSDDSNFALVLNPDNELKICSANNLPDNLSEMEFFTPDIKAMAKVSDGTNCSIDVCGIVGETNKALKSKCETQAKDIKEKDTTISALESENKKLKESEMEHRTCSVVSALENKYNADKKLFNASEMISEDSYKTLMQDARNGVFSKCVDDKGKFVGIEAATQRYLAARSESIENFRQTQAENNKKNLSWSFDNKSGSDNGNSGFDMDALLDGLSKM